MTKRLEELFELASARDRVADSVDVEEDAITSLMLPDNTVEITENALSNLEKIDAALPQIRGLEKSDNELDELSEMAVNSYKDISDLALNVESRFSAELFGAASNFLGHALTAKTAKINRKLRTLEIQLKKAQLDAKIQSKNEVLDSMPAGEGQSLDRNELLKMISASQQIKP